MKEVFDSRRKFLKAAGLTTGAVLLSSGNVVAESGVWPQSSESHAVSESNSADYTLHIKTSPVEIAPNKIISATTYNGQFPGPLLRFKEDQQVTVDVLNDTDVPGQLHWHGQTVPVDVDGAAEEGTPFIPGHGNGGFYSLRDPQDFVSITRTIELDQISMRDNMAARLVPCISSQSMSQAIMTARCFLC